MLTKQVNNTIIVRLDRGEEIVASLKQVSEQYQLRAASVTGIGAVKGATVCLYNIETGVYSDTALPQFLEMTNLSGNVSVMNGAPYLHLHITLADGNGHAFGGHLKEAFIGATAEIFVTAFATSIDRVRDEATGLNLFAL